MMTTLLLVFLGIAIGAPAGFVLGVFFGSWLSESKTRISFDTDFDPFEDSTHVFEHSSRNYSRQRRD